VTVQVWDSRPGNDFVAWMDRSIRAAERILVVLTPAYDQATSFTVPELSAAIGRDPTGELGVLLPVRVVDFTPDGLLRTRSWVDLVGKDRQAAREALLAGVSQERPKPDREPPFPGEQPPEPVFPGKTPPTPTGQAPRRAQLNALYIQARAELRLEHFAAAIELFDELLTLDPYYQDAAALRDAARRAGSSPTPTRRPGRRRTPATGPPQPAPTTRSCRSNRPTGTRPPGGRRASR
jgi:hypothetical protein